MQSHSQEHVQGSAEKMVRFPGLRPAGPVGAVPAGPDGPFTWVSRTGACYWGGCPARTRPCRKTLVSRWGLILSLHRFRCLVSRLVVMPSGCPFSAGILLGWVVWCGSLRSHRTIG
jgi:hypothetical protein